MKIAVAFLCYNQSSAPYLPDFLKSLNQALRLVEAEILLLAGDNSDQEPNPNQTELRHYNETALFPAKTIVFGANLGFAAAYNRLLDEAAAAQADYFLMLNPDMLLDEKMIRELLSAFKNDHTLAAACPKIYRWDFSTRTLTNLIDSCGIALRPGLRFYDVGQGREDKELKTASPIIGPSGAAAFFQMEALVKIKEGKQYFDERFFMYKEDCDLAYRLQAAGLKSILVPSAIAYHDRSAAVQAGILHTWRHWRGRSRQTRSWSFVNQHLLFIKHWHQEGLFSRIFIIAEVLFLGLFSLILAPFLLKGYLRLFRYLRGLD